MEREGLSLTVNGVRYQRDVEPRQEAAQRPK